MAVKQSYADLQVLPRVRRPHEVDSRRALAVSVAYLVRTAQNLAGAEPDYAGALYDSLKAIRHAYRALLEWHGLAPRPDASLADLHRPAERLASMLRTCWDRTGFLGPLERSLRSGASPSAYERDHIATSFYTARNTLMVVLASLPERVRLEAIESLNRAQAIRTGRCAVPSPERRSERTVQSLNERKARPYSFPATL